MNFKSSLLFCAVLLSGPAFAGDVDSGKALSQTCAACHGADGNSTIPTNPKLAGQYESYLVQALKSYKDGSRQNAIMGSFASQLTDENIADLAAYFASQTPSISVVDR